MGKLFIVPNQLFKVLVPFSFGTKAYNLGSLVSSNDQNIPNNMFGLFLAKGFLEVTKEPKAKKK